MATNRERALDAAIELLAHEGIRALTHLRVDERAELPRGSTSNAFRTRRALLLGVCERMARSELPVVGAGEGAANPDELVDALVAAFEHMIGPGRETTSARLALFVEAGHDHEIRAALARGRESVEGPLLRAFAALGAPDAAFAVQLVASCFEGMLLQALGRYATIEPRPLIDAVVRAALS